MQSFDLFSPTDMIFSELINIASFICSCILHARFFYGKNSFFQLRILKALVNKFNFYVDKNNLQEKR